MENSFIKLFLVFGILGVTFPSCDLFKTKGCTNPNSFNYDKNADKDDGSCSDMSGCLGYNSGFSNSGMLGVTLHNTYYDQKMNEEVSLQRSFFNGISANVFILYEGDYSQRNAYASSNGQILFGYHMFYYTISKYNELAAAGILAHEWGHRAQQSLGWNSNNKNPEIELEADAFSGYYMALAKSFAWSQIQGYYSSTYATGDYNFNSPSHHGTPDQRLASAYLGVQTAIDAVNNEKTYNYEELHDIFMSTITSEITSNNIKDKTPKSVYGLIASGLSKGEDVSIPSHVNEDQRKRFYPRLECCLE